MREEEEDEDVSELRRELETLRSQVQSLHERERGVVSSVLHVLQLTDLLCCRSQHRKRLYKVGRVPAATVGWAGF